VKDALRKANMPIFNLRELAYPRVAAALYKNALLSLFFVQDGFPYKNAGAMGEPRHRKKPTRLKEAVGKAPVGVATGEGKPPLISVRSKLMRVLRKGLEIS
jgi:hypothetical protein